MLYTIQLFRHLYENLPPLFPVDIADKIKKSLDRFENETGASLVDLEAEMVKFGYDVWPWQQAYKDFFYSTEQKIGEHFLLSHLSDNLQGKYDDFKEYGGTWHDIYSGRPADFFTSEERVELTKVLIETRQKLKQYTQRELIGLSKKDYLRKVEKYNQLLEEIKKDLDYLREQIQTENEHFMLVAEMKEKIRDIEHSLCLLGKELRYDEVKNARDFFQGRRTELNRLRGIHLPAEVDFYSMD